MMSFKLVHVPSFIPPGIQAKIYRANENIINLPDELRAFFKKHDYRVVRDTKTEPIENAFRFGEPTIIPAPPLDEFSVLCGEILYHLRSSLDQLIWELIKCNGGDPDKLRPRPEFPIYADRAKYKAEGARKVQGISPWAQTQVELAQPFPGRHNWPLRYVHELNIIDKHRSLNTVASWATIKFRHDGVLNTVRCKLKGRTVLFVPPIDGEMDLDSEPVFHVSLAEAGFLEAEDIVNALQFMSDHVFRLICSFEKALK